jgi:hypothetical protein
METFTFAIIFVGGLLLLLAAVQGGYRYRSGYYPPYRHRYYQGIPPPYYEPDYPHPAELDHYTHREHSTRLAATAVFVLLLLFLIIWLGK